MQSEIFRLSSYVQWPTNAKIGPSMLARSGFVYSGHGECCVCFQCKLTVEHWQDADIPDNIHLQRSPNCSFIIDKCKNRIGNNTATTATPVTPAPLTTLARGSDHADSVLGTNRSYTQSSVPIVASPSGTTNDPVIDRNNPDFELLRSERVRLLTFHDWPERAAQIVEARQLAQTGLYFTGQADRVQCVFCRGFLRNWVQGDQPADEHRRHFPDCAFVRGQQVGNVLDCVDTPTSPLTRTSSQYVPSVRETSAPPAPVLLPRPRHPNFVTLESRIQSFQGKRVPDGQQPNVLALAGFFYVGPQDNVRCFQCDGGLKNWQPNDIAWTEHKRWFPRCPYVLIHPNGPAADNSTAMMLVEPAAVNNAARQLDHADNVTDRVQYRVEPREIKARMDTPFVKTVLDQGHPRELVRQAIERRLTTTGNTGLEIYLNKKNNKYCFNGDCNLTILNHPF